MPIPGRSQIGCGVNVKSVQVADKVIVFSKGGGTGTGPSGASDVFALSSDSMMEIAPAVSKVRATLQIQNSTEAFETKVVYQTSEDGNVWNPPVDITAGPETGGYVSGNVYNTSSWVAVSNTLRAMRFGVIAAQKTGTAVQMGLVSVVVDVQFIQ